MVVMYFLDFWSDTQVCVLFFTTDEWVAGAFSVLFLLVQYAAIVYRSLDYLGNTFGRESKLYKRMLYFGFPLGAFVLDMLMFLEPFGLLPIVNGKYLPGWLCDFLPAYKSTRVILSIAANAVPQGVLQAGMFVYVCYVGASHPMYSDVQAIPTSILITTVNNSKVWKELVESARDSKISCSTRILQLWNVGAGLPLDAIKKSTTTSWTCTYPLAREQLGPLFDALGRNKSLISLDLGACVL